LLITAKNIKDGRLDFEKSKEYIAEDGYDSWMVRGMPEKGDVMVTTEAPLGATAQIEDENVALAQRLILLKADKEQMDNTFLKYYFLSQAGQDELYSQGTGSTAIGIKASKFYNINTIIPPLAEQKKIVEYIVNEESRILSFAKKTDEIIEFLQEYRTALISEAVTGKIDVRTAETVHESPTGTM
jgi:type I restriction enzyme S subunit